MKIPRPLLLSALVTGLAFAQLSVSSASAFEQVRGHFQWMNGTTMMLLKTDDGRLLRVDTSAVDQELLRGLLPRQRVVVIGQPGDPPNQFVALDVRQESNLPQAQ